MNKDFEQLAHQKRSTLASEFLAFLRYNKKWWLIPILLMMALLGWLVLLGGSSLAPFIYPLF